MLHLFMANHKITHWKQLFSAINLTLIFIVPLRSILERHHAEYQKYRNYCTC